MGRDNKSGAESRERLKANEDEEGINEARSRRECGPSW